MIPVKCDSFGVKRPDGIKGFQRLASALGRGANLCLVRQVPASYQGLRRLSSHRGCLASRDLPQAPDTPARSAFLSQTLRYIGDASTDVHCRCGDFKSSNPTDFVYPLFIALFLTAGDRSAFNPQSEYRPQPDLPSWTPVNCTISEIAIVIFALVAVVTLALNPTYFQGLLISCRFFAPVGIRVCWQQRGWPKLDPALLRIFDELFVDPSAAIITTPDAPPDEATRKGTPRHDYGPQMPDGGPSGFWINWTKNFAYPGSHYRIPDFSAVSLKQHANLGTPYEFRLAFQRIPKIKLKHQA